MCQMKALDAYKDSNELGISEVEYLVSTTNKKEELKMTHKKITAQEGYIFVRIHDNFKMSNEITLGYDYSTGVKREDKEEYYRQEVAPETETEELEE